MINLIGYIVLVLICGFVFSVLADYAIGILIGDEYEEEDSTNIDDLLDGQRGA